MTKATEDANSIKTALALLNTNGTTLTPVKADPSAHTMLTSDGTTGSDHGPINAERDDNYETTYMATSSDDGVTPVALYADSNGRLLVQST